MEIHETRSSQVNNGIVTLDDIRKIAHYFLGLLEGVGDRDRASVTFRVSCSDGSYYSSAIQVMLYPERDTEKRECPIYYRLAFAC